MAEKTETQKKPIKELDHQKIGKIIRLFGILLCIILAFGFAFTKAWYLAFLAAIIGGAFFNRMIYGFLVGMIGVGLGWSMYVLVEVGNSNIEILINQVTGIIIGDQSLGWVIILVIIVVGLIIGMLGGTLGSALRKILEPVIKKKMNKQE
ncbi:MAG: hypothetical protein FK733_01700 [Asgard group archaeon]|nr:hypothetical protein [Asgard group archaeon]